MYLGAHSLSTLSLFKLHDFWVIEVVKSQVQVSLNFHSNNRKSTLTRGLYQIQIDRNSKKFNRTTLTPWGFDSLKIWDPTSWKEAPIVGGVPQLWLPGMEQQPMEEPIEGEKCFAWRSIHGRLWTASFLSAKFYEWNRKSSMQFLKFLILGKRRIPSWLPYIILQILRLFNLQTTFSIIQSFGVQLGTLLLPSEKGNGTEHKSRGKNSLGYLVTKR